MQLSGYTPSNYAKEYTNLCGSSQYPMFVATALGVKPCFDDWVNVRKYEEFVSICKEYNLHVEPDVIFINTKEDKKNVIGGKSITTTFTKVIPFKKMQKIKTSKGQVHVFVSRSKKNAIQTRKFGWYPGIIEGRITNKPFVDHMRFGKNLGFPDCCINFFKAYNNWAKYSHPYESYKKTPKDQASYYCNYTTMDFTFFLIHHLPCNFVCPSTIKLAKEIEEKIYEVEPKFVKKTREILKGPMVIFAERNCYLFEGKMEGQQVDYKSCRYITNYARKEDKVKFEDKIKNGDRLIFSNNQIIIEKNNQEIFRGKKEPEWFLIDFK